MKPEKSSKLKISIIVSDLSSSGAGRWGGGIRPFLLSQTLRKLGFEVEMLGVAYGQANTSMIDRADIPIVAIPCGYHSGFLRAAFRVVEAISGDIIYAVKPKPSSFGIALIKKWLSGKPLILDIDDWETSWFGGESFQYRPRPKQLARDLLKPEGALRHPDHPVYLQWLEKFIDKADAITTHNQFLQQRFGGVYIPNGKDVALFNPDSYDAQASKAKYGLSGSRILMFPGAPRPYKGLEDVLEALEILDQEDLKLVIVGGSPYDDYDQKLVKTWGSWIVQIPKQPVEAMPSIVAAADVIVVPQRDTPAAMAQFPLKLTDGMAMAKPILATRVGDIPKILADTGYLVAPNSPTEMAAAITTIFQDLAAAQAKGLQARTRCVKHYSIETMAANLATVIESIQNRI